MAAWFNPGKDGSRRNQQKSSASAHSLSPEDFIEPGMSTLWEAEAWEVPAQPGCLISEILSQIVIIIKRLGTQLSAKARGPMLSTGQKIFFKNAFSFLLHTQ